MFWRRIHWTQILRARVLVAFVFALVAVGGLCAAVCDFRFVEHPKAGRMLSPRMQLGIDARVQAGPVRSAHHQPGVPNAVPSMPAAATEFTAPVPQARGDRNRATHLGQFPPGNGANAGQGVGRGNGFGNNNGGNAGFGNPSGGQGGVYVKPTVRLTPEPGDRLRLRRIEAVRARPTDRDRYSADQNLDSL
jgi:hypothetical protein